MLTTKHVDPLTLDKFAKVLYALIKKKYLIPRSLLVLDWRPLYELYHYWDNCSLSLRGLLKTPTSFKDDLKNLIKFCRAYFSDDSTSEMLVHWRT